MSENDLPDHLPDASEIDRKLQAALRREHLTPASRKSNEPDDDSYSSGLGYGMRLGMEFMGGTAVGMGIGYGIDRLFDSSPLGLLVFTLFGFGAGMLNMYRLINRIDDTIGVGRKTPLQPPSGLTKAGRNGTSGTGNNPSDNST